MRFYARTPAATHRSIICPPRHRFTLRFFHVAGATQSTLGGDGRGERPLQAGREVQREDGQRFVQPFSDAAGGAGIFVLQALGEIREEPCRRLYVGGLIGAADDRLHPRALPLWQVVEDVAEACGLGTAE